MHRYLKKIGNTDCILSWKSKGFSDEIIKPTTSSLDNSLSPALNYIGNKTRVKFDGSYLKQGKITFTHEKIVNIYIVYKTNFWKYVDSSDPALRNSLFGTVKLVKNADIDKYKYSGYGLGFDMKETFSFPTGVSNSITFSIGIQIFICAKKNS